MGRTWVIGWMAVAALMSAVWLVGFVAAAMELLGPGRTGPASPAQPETVTDEAGSSRGSEAGPLRLVGLGDSIMRGIGDGEGGGVFRRFGERLATADPGRRPPVMVNLAVAGDKSADLWRRLALPEFQTAVLAADGIVLSIGGNDAFPSVDVLKRPAAYADPEAISAFQATMETVLRALRQDNPKAPILWLGLYDPFSDVPGLSGAAEAALDRWNAAIHAAARSAPGVIVVPTNDLRQAAGAAFLAGDHFHPSAVGHALLAGRLAEVWAALRR
ncbi:GDSL-type esterase/lipase family protein [Hydrogenibacillus sp. N12]|uniref:GDSL-type esterase/lipase family protein n=1 Tax=Hydrogenibacillus sp. N12 TaxID=2866627 RepID=UPI001C7DF905|nr:GDSL-type esterase/lipase family protein [Hydrogenibacillus sp. N12]QZA32537.1 hypothetical protein K2M58_09600 [Hydrogenibacillus sp. N12]